jgi:hypothetical protein
MKTKAGKILFIIGIIFIIYAIFGRYLVLPGYLSSLEEGQHTVSSASQNVAAWKIVRYLLWAYAFKLGIYFMHFLGAETPQLAVGRSANPPLQIQDTMAQ